MKVYVQGTAVVVDTEIAGQELKYIPLQFAKFEVLPGGTIVIWDYTDTDDELSYKAPIADVKNQAGIPLGGKADVVDYLTEFISSTQQLKNSVTHEELTNPGGNVYQDFKSLSFVCDGTIDVTINGITIQYPKTMGGLTILGENLQADTKAEYSVRFAGTGSVLITLQK